MKWRLWVVAMLSLRPVVAADLVLAQDGHAVAAIRLEREDCRPAAEELATYLGRLTGATFQVATDTPSPALRVGDPAAAGVKAEDLGRDGCVLRTVGPDLVLAGATPLGTSYAVTTLLERLGCGWYWPGEMGEVVPAARGDLSVPALDEIHKPSFRIRWIGRNRDWCRRNYTNVAVDLPGEFKVKWFVHTWQDLVPPDEFYDTHPEYYPQLGGTRIDPRTRPGVPTNLCASNPEVAGAAARTIDKLMAEDPDIDMISVDPEDTQVFCDCDTCRAFEDRDAPYGLRNSRLVFQFTNRVAALVAERHPRLLIKTIAYSTYVQPPADPQWKPLPNVAIQFCRFEDHNHALADPRSKKNQGYDAWYRDWRSRTDNVLFYEYYHKVSWLGLPWPIVRMLRGDLPRFRDDRLLGVASQWSVDFATHGLGYWLAAQLLWDAGADVDALIHRYCQDLLGPAGGTMEQYYRSFEQAADASGLELADQRPYLDVLRLFTPELLEQMDGLLAKALAEADTEQRRARVNGFRAGLAYTHLVVDYLGAIAAAGAGATVLWDNMSHGPTIDWAALEAQAAAIKAFIEEPGLQYWVDQPNGYLNRLLQPRQVWPILQPRTGLTTPQWRRDRPAKSAPERMALWLYGNDWDRDGAGPEHEVWLRTVGAETWVRAGELAPPGVDGNRRNLAVVLSGLPRDEVGPGPWEVRVDNLPGGPWASTLYGAWLLPDTGPLPVDQATLRVETETAVVRGEAVAFCELPPSGVMCGEQQATVLMLER